MSFFNHYFYMWLLVSVPTAFYFSQLNKHDTNILNQKQEVVEQVQYQENQTESPSILHISTVYSKNWFKQNHSDITDININNIKNADTLFYRKETTQKILQNFNQNLKNGQMQYRLTYDHTNNIITMNFHTPNNGLISTLLFIELTQRPTKLNNGKDVFYLKSWTLITEDKRYYDSHHYINKDNILDYIKQKEFIDFSLLKEIISQNPNASQDIKNAVQNLDKSFKSQYSKNSSIIPSRLGQSLKLEGDENINITPSQMNEGKRIYLNSMRK